MPIVDPLQREKRKTALVAVMILSAMTVLVAYSPTLYRLFCSATGYGGTVRVGTAKSLSATGAGKPVTIRFDANVAPGLDWDFVPEVRSVETTFGTPTKVYYKATNNSKETVVARATFNITPYAAAPYFYKIECFCFTNERLGPGESARMPLVLYVDGEMLNDATAKLDQEITLSYTFFRQNGLSEEEIAKARDLSTGSEATDARLRNKETAGFDNEAPRK